MQHGLFSGNIKRFRRFVIVKKIHASTNFISKISKFYTREFSPCDLITHLVDIFTYLQETWEYENAWQQILSVLLKFILSNFLPSSVHFWTSLKSVWTLIGICFIDHFPERSNNDKGRKLRNRLHSVAIQVEFCKSGVQEHDRLFLNPNGWIYF